MLHDEYLRLVQVTFMEKNKAPWFCSLQIDSGGCMYLVLGDDT